MIFVDLSRIQVSFLRIFLSAEGCMWLTQSDMCNWHRGGQIKTSHFRKQANIMDANWAEC